MRFETNLLNLKKIILNCFIHKDHEPTLGQEDPVLVQVRIGLSIVWVPVCSALANLIVAI